MTNRWSQFNLGAFLQWSLLAGALLGLVAIYRGLGAYLLLVLCVFGCAGLFISSLILVSLVLTTPKEPDYHAQLWYATKLMLWSAGMVSISMTLIAIGFVFSSLVGV